jgi:hypothetical protein
MYLGRDQTNARGTIMLLKVSAAEDACDAMPKIKVRSTVMNKDVIARPV